MGLFDNFTQPGGAAGDWATQAAQAQAAADQLLKNSGYAGGLADPGAYDVQQGLADRGAIEAQANEQNRILTVGSPATITILSKTATGESAGGNPVYLLHLRVQPEGGEAYEVQKREIISSVALSGYADGTSLAGRIDPADRNLVAFGDKPWR